MTTWAKIKLAIGAVLAVLVIIVFLQNTERVPTDLLWAKYEVPYALILLGMLFVGFLFGVATGLWMTRDRKKSAKPKEGEPPAPRPKPEPAPERDQDDEASAKE